MGLKLYDETSVQAIADAIRAKNGSSDTYTISEMSTAIEDIPSGGGGGTHTETKTVTFLNTTTSFNVGDNFLSGYGVYPQDSSYALAIAVSDGVGFAARLHNGVVDGYSASCTYSDGVFTFDSAFVLNYMGSSVYSLNCLFNDGEQSTIVNGQILTDNSFTDDFQLFSEGSMSNTTTAGGKANITWKGGSSIGYCRCGKTAYRNAKKIKVHIDYYGDSYGHQHTNNRNWDFAVFVTDIQLTSAITLTNLINDSHCLDYIECDNNQYYGQMNLDFEIDLSEITDAVYISFQSPGVTIQGLKITVVYEDESEFTGYNQIFKDKSMDVRFDPNGKFKVIWDGVTTVAIGCTMQGHTNLIGTYNNINIKGNITDSCEYIKKYGYERTQFVVGVTKSDWQDAILVGYNDNGDVYKKEVITLTNQQVVNDIDIDIDLNELAQQGYQSAYLFISLLGISGEFEVTIS